MSAYLHDGAAALDGEDQVGCTVDCSSVKPSELLTLALTSQTSKSPGGAAAEYAMWLPPQAILFVCSVCSSYVIASYSVCALKQLLAIRGFTNTKSDSLTVVSCKGFKTIGSLCMQVSLIVISYICVG